MFQIATTCFVSGRRGCVVEFRTSCLAGIACEGDGKRDQRRNVRSLTAEVSWMKDLDHRNQPNTGRPAASEAGASPGKRTLTESLSGEVASGGSTGVVQRSAAGTPGAGSALQSMGSLFGRDFSAVQLHTDTAADARARSLGTEAVAEGHDIPLRHGAFAPDTRHGKEVLGHELAHVVQQQDHAPTAQTYVPVGARGDAFEQEASRAEIGRAH